MFKNLSCQRWINIPLQKQNIIRDPADSHTHSHVILSPTHTPYTNRLTRAHWHQLTPTDRWQKSPSSDQERDCDALGRTLPGGKGFQDTAQEQRVWILKQPHLCVSAIFSLSFSDLRWASAGPAWEAFSSSVPLTLDAWVEDGVSHPDSWPKWIIFTCYCLSLHWQQIRHNEKIWVYESRQTHSWV